MERINNTSDNYTIKSTHDIDTIIDMWRTEDYYPSNTKLEKVVACIPTAAIHIYFCNQLNNYRKERRNQQQNIKTKRISTSSTKKNVSNFANRIISRFIVPDKVIEKYKAELKPRSKTFLHKSTECEICGEPTKCVYCYLDKANYNTYICPSCNSQLHIRPGKKLFVSTPMGGQNKKY